MGLRRQVIVRNVSNLSDARYCAGMGADILGFIVDSDHPDKISIEDFNELRSWVEGVKFALQLDHQNENPTEINPSELDADFEIINLDQLKKDKGNSRNTLCTLDLVDLDGLLEIIDKDNSVHIHGLILSIDYQDLLNDRSGLIGKLNSLEDIVVFVDMPELDNHIEEVCEKLKNAGFALTGSQELKPGYKDFYDLAPVLEYLEE